MTDTASNIVSFQEAKEEREPYAKGYAKCLRCKHEWFAEVLLGTDAFDCPECDCGMGSFIHPFGAVEGDSVYMCNCGCDSFSFINHKGEERVICRSCGQLHLFDNVDWCNT